MRPLRENERQLVRAMLKNAQQEDLGDWLSSSLVEDMDDGGMGSIRFLNSESVNRSSNNVLAQAEYTDEDGVLVSIVLYGDTAAALTELDVWKVDFSALRRYPSPSELTFTA